MVYHNRNRCVHHPPADGRCHAITYKGTRCVYQAAFAQLNSLPVCGRHRNTMLPAGRCQAVALCGQPCYHLSASNPPNHFCAIHEHGPEPCHMMRLPTELRLMIYRLILPDMVPPLRRFHNSRANHAVFKLNRQIYQEASAVFYEELEFKAAISHSDIDYMDKSWGPEDHVKMAKQLQTTAAKRVRHLSVEVIISGTPKLSYEANAKDFRLLELRSAIRNFTKALSTAKRHDGSITCQDVHLKVTPRIADNHDWTSNDLVQALFVVIEPFRFLNAKSATLMAPSATGIISETQQRIVDETVSCSTYHANKEAWIRCTTQAAAHEQTDSDNVIQCYTAYKKITKALSTVTASHRFHASSRYPIELLPLPCTEFPRVLARVAVENQDLPVLHHIQDAIGNRWVRIWRHQQRSMRELSQSISTMFQSSEGGVRTGSSMDLFPDAFSTDTFEETLPDVLPHRWNDLTLTDSAPEITDNGVTFREEELKVHIQKDGQEWVRWKTPTMMAKIRKFKDAEEA